MLLRASFCSTEFTKFMKFILYSADADFQLIDIYFKIAGRLSWIFPVQIAFVYFIASVSWKNKLKKNKVYFLPKLKSSNWFSLNTDLTNW